MSRFKTTSMQLLVILFMGWLLGNQISETHGCFSVEREALLGFKSGIVDPLDRLSSWEGSDCCTWKGVRCNNKTGRVEKLNLKNPNGTFLASNLMGLRGEVNSSLLSLSHLKHLDLSMNNFNTNFPNFIASYKKLRYLNLSRAGFTSGIPLELGNLSTLRYLDIGASYFFYGTTSHDKLFWIKGLSSLKYLDLSYTMLWNADDWLQAVNMLSSLQVLRLEQCDLPSNPNPISDFNLTSLSILDLSSNSFNSPWPRWLLNFTSLTYLNLYNNNISGPIPVDLNNFTLLTSLILASNNLEGPIANSINNLCRLDTLILSEVNIDRDISEFMSELSCVPPNNWQILDLANTKMTGNLSGWLEHMTSLIYLDVSNNFLNGSLPVGIHKLSNLAFLNIFGNSFAGVILETHLMNLTRLKVLWASGTALHLKVGDNWVPPFQAQELVFSACRLGPQFPKWLQFQQEIKVLNLSDTGIAETIPDWFWDIPSPIFLLDLSNNQISDMLPSSLENRTSLEVLRLDSNYLQGFLPILPNSLIWLDISSNMFTGLLPRSFFKLSLEVILLSNNSISGKISSSICSMQYLSILDLSNNNLFGEMPNCWSDASKGLTLINLSNNKLSGQLPHSLGSVSNLEFLHLNNNSLYGELPSSLQYCPLVLLDLGQNKLSGEITTWLGKLTELIILRLMSNMFVGNIPVELGQLENLQILDLSWNNLSGYIPQSFGNLSAMASTKLPEYMDQTFFYFGIWKPAPTCKGCILLYPTYVNYNSERLYITTKNLNLPYSWILFLEKSIDLSGNNLHGAILDEIVDLFQLKNLNLSRNHLTGRIPNKIGNLQSLESLDLSMNELNGTIPQSIATITSLESLNLSYNNLSGRIPSGDQIQTLDDPTIYAGNPYLCGFPILKNCFGNEPTYDPEKKHNGGLENIEFYLGMVLGFVVGLWGVFVVLLFKSAWRNAYFYLIDKMYFRYFAGYLKNFV